MDVIAVLGGPCCIPFDISAAAAVLKPRVDAALDLVRTTWKAGNAQVLLIVAGSAKSAFVPARKRRRDGTGVRPTTPTISHGEYLRTALASALLETGLGIGETPAAVQKILLDDGCTDLLAMAHASLNVARKHAKRRMSANEGAVALVSRADTPGKGTGQDHTSNDGETARSAAISSRKRREISLGRTRCRSQALLASGDAKRPPNCAQNATWDANALKTGDMPALSPAAREVPMVASRGSNERIPARA